MEAFIQLLIYIHVAAGVMALVAAPVALATQKGGNTHRSWGKIYFWAMTVVVITAVIVSVYKFIPFLLMIAVFSYYAVLSGYRILYLKKLHKGQKPHWVDWLSSGIAMAFNLYFVGWGLYYLMSGVTSPFYFLAIIFGLGGVYLVYTNTKQFFQSPKSGSSWLFAHLGNMIGGYIATVTAFSTNVMHFMPTLLQWLWPSLVGVPLIILWSRYYRKKLKLT